MKVLLIAPCVFQLPLTRYGGVEALLTDYAKELVALGCDVTVAAPKGSKVPCGLIETVDLRFHSGFGDAEVMAYEWYDSLLKTFDVILDFSHGKVASFRNLNLPAANILWFEPVWFTEKRGQPFPVPHNPVVFSNWQLKQFRRVYEREAVLQPVICRDAEEYKPSEERSDRYIFIGKLSSEKGALEIIKFCKELGVPCDILGGFGVGDLTYYREDVMKACDGKHICFYPNVTNEVKVELLRKAKALLYYPNFPEASNMVVVESFLCGVPAVVRDIGAMNEVVNDGVTGWLAQDEEDFRRCMIGVDTLDRKQIREEAEKRYSSKVVLQGWLPLMERVAGGLRW